MCPAMDAEAARDDGSDLLQQVARLAVQVNSETSADMALDAILCKARELLDAERAFVSATVGPAWRQRTVVAAPWGADLPGGCELAAIACETGLPLRRSSEALRRHAAGCAPHARTMTPMTGGWIAVPLIRQNGLNIGLIQLFGRAHREFDDADETLLLQLAQLASATIVRAQLLAEVQQYAIALEKRVAERTAELEGTNADLEAFAYSVSHDLRIPLQSLTNFAELLADEYSHQLDPQARIYTERIVATAGRMTQLIRDLLEFSRIGRSQRRLEPLSVDDVVERAAARIDPVAFGGSAELRLEASELEVLGHEPTLVQALVNLISNAVKFVAAGVEPRVRIWAEERGETVRLWVEDNGIGVPVEAQERIFEPFQRLGSSVTRPGSGIGLAIVRRAVTSIGGKVGVESTPGRGSAFWMDLPRARRGAPTPAEHAAWP